MNTNKRTKSISRKINRGIIFRQLRAFILINMILLASSTALWCFSQETSSGEAPDGISTVRLFAKASSIDDSPALQKEFKSASKQNELIWFPSEKFRNTLSDSVYVYQNGNGKIHYAYSGTFFIYLFSSLLMLSAAEFLILFGTAVSGSRKVRRQLTPLDELAFKAELLGDAASLDQQALEELEHAINTINPAGDGTLLHTGNAEMQQLEKSINSLLDRMRESYRQQSRFVSDASHELRTPISVLQGYVNMLDRWGKNDEKILDESIEAIKSETEHMKKLVEQLLFLARGDSGKTKLTLETFSLNDMMKEVYEESSMIDKEHIYKFAPHSDEVFVNGDISMLKQTARILIDNAAKYASANSVITLKTAFKTKTTESGTYERHPAFIIQDEGIGIAANEVPHMFERFYRSDPARTKDGGGTGLGLSIAKWIVDRHSGYFEVLSRKEIGTRISVILPQK